MNKDTRIALVLRGHFRSFEKNEESWRKLLEPFHYDSYFHSWDTLDCNNQTWDRRYTIESRNLNNEEISILRKWDPNVVIEKQEFSKEDNEKIYASWAPHKSLIYRFDSLLNTLKRIDKTKYDIIIVSRYDILLKNVNLEKLTINPGTLLLGGRECPDILGKIAANAELLIFHSSNLDKFYNPLINADPKKYKNAEEWFAEMYQRIFKEIKHEWKWEEDFILDKSFDKNRIGY